jgi:hypothetical protein
MPNLAKFKLIAPALALVVLLAVPAVAEATLTFTRGPENQFNPSVYVSKDDGSAVRKIGPGHSPHISSDGASVAYFHEGPGHKAELKVAPTAGGAGKTLMSAGGKPSTSTGPPTRNRSWPCAGANSASASWS